MDLGTAHRITTGITQSISKALIGKELLVKHVVATLIAGGHVLIEGPPGVAKTLLAKSLAKAIKGEFRRVQGNPDLLPTDLTGYYVYSLDGSKRFVKGPVFTNILMFDELNRTPTRVQSALLQVMAERQASVDGVTHELPRPFHVIATEVLSGGEVGVYPLTLTLKDRFWIRCVTTYNPFRDELIIVRRADELYKTEASGVEGVTDVETFLKLQDFLGEGIYADERIVHYISKLVDYVRRHEDVELGGSHRGSIYLYRVSKALALMDGRDYVIPDDVKEVAVQVLAHRLVLKEEARVRGVKPEEVVREALDTVEVPKE